MHRDIEHLNKALKGEYMAIESFDHFIQDVDDSLIKEKLIQVERHHKNQTIRIAERIQQQGGNPINHTGFTGIMAEVKQKFDKKTTQRDEIMARCIDGEKLGIDEFKKILKDLEKEDNRILIKDIINNNEKILEDLINYH